MTARDTESQLVLWDAIVICPVNSVGQRVR